MFETLNKEYIFDKDLLTNEEKDIFDLIYPDWNKIPTMLKPSKEEIRYMFNSVRPEVLTLENRNKIIIQKKLSENDVRIENIGSYISSKSIFNDDNTISTYEILTIPIEEIFNIDIIISTEIDIILSKKINDITLDDIYELDKTLNIKQYVFWASPISYQFGLAIDGLKNNNLKYVKNYIETNREFKNGNHKLDLLAKKFVADIWLDSPREPDYLQNLRFITGKETLYYYIIDHLDIEHDNGDIYNCYSKNGSNLFNYWDKRKMLTDGNFSLNNTFPSLVDLINKGYDIRKKSTPGISILDKIIEIGFLNKARLKTLDTLLNNENLDEKTRNCLGAFGHFYWKLLSTPDAIDLGFKLGILDMNDYKYIYTLRRISFTRFSTKYDMMMKDIYEDYHSIKKLLSSDFQNQVINTPITLVVTIIGVIISVFTIIQTIISFTQL